jgi:hypothetical protein
LYADRPVGNQHGRILWVGAAAENISGQISVTPKEGFVFVAGRFENKPLGIFDRYFGSLKSIEIMYPVSKSESETEK